MRLGIPLGILGQIAFTEQYCIYLAVYKLEA